MKEYFGTLILTGIPCLLLWGILIWSMRRDRSRYRNCFLLMFAGRSSIIFLSSLAGRYAAHVRGFFFVIIVIAILLVPFILVANGLIMIKREGHGFKHLLSLLLGLLVGVGELSTFAFLMMQPYSHEYYETWAKSDRLGSSLLLIISISVIYTSLIFVAFMFYTLFLEIIPRKRDFDYVIIHGAGLLNGNKISKLFAQRIDKAIEVYRKDPTPPIIIPSGGQGPDETISEAEAMTEYLLDHGIPRENILPENTSTTTMENLRNSKKLIEARGGRHYTALVTSNYHVYRALRYCRKIGLKCTGIGAHVAAYYWPSALIREFVAVHREKKHLFLFVLGWLFAVVPLVVANYL